MSPNLILVGHAKFLILSNMIRSVIRSMIRDPIRDATRDPVGNPVRDPVRDPIRSDPDFVDVGIIIQFAPI